MTSNAIPDKRQSILEPLDEHVDHIRGPTAGRLILEYGDYECPYSRQAFRQIEHVEQRHSGGVRFAFRQLAFNVGVELGQLLAIVAMFMLGDVIGYYIKWLKEPRRLHAGLIAAGLVAGGVLAVTGDFNGSDPPAQALGGCQVRDRIETYAGGGGHPLKDFFEPGETAPDKSFGHVIGDGFVIVHYQPSLPADQVAQLRAFVTDPQSGRVVGGPAPGQAEAVTAVNAYTTIVCATFDIHAVRNFTSGWFDDPRSKPPE